MVRTPIPNLYEGPASLRSMNSALHPQALDNRELWPVIDDRGIFSTTDNSQRESSGLLNPSGSNERIPTGLPSLDSILGGGVSPGKLNVLCAYTGVGKSSFAVHLACTAVGFDFGVILLHTEMTVSNDYGPRILAWKTGHSYSKIRNRDVEVAPHVATEFGRNIHFVEPPENSRNWARELRKSIEQYAGLHPEGLLVIVDSMDRLEDSSERVALENVALTLSDIARDLEVPIWATTQANDTALEADTLGAESIRDARGKGIPASLVLGMGRSDRSEKEEIATLTSIKTRDTPPFQIRVRTELSCQRFMDLSDAFIPPGRPTPA